ncbi:helix-turn-helix domain-containing protein [Croceicoccus naphthovorans]|uniref:TetR family transcriptional regulator n=1 Tax=Croceicoccus naphthovorans TaxID=1348774 RepID=A0A0G3XGB9_9SPHN|nr:helix-turn-helix domain-containing protein [Croceicoccus naphthovorans]AKM10540.1 TetR family transcriptional regulator [Croceicoccus naphthovorans]MBB3988738.1 AcrR family transcriptional regulator [Croceicoccus naphthovorans]
MSTRKRLNPEDSRRVALAAARELLIESGPQAVTLKAVAARMGRTHSNVLHHFGSAAGLQKALAGHLGSTICETIGEAVQARRAGLGSARDVVDLVFDAFGKEGAGALASWMTLSGNEDALDPIFEAIHDLVDKIGPEGEDWQRVREATMSLVLQALGDAMIGGALAQSLDFRREHVREMASRQLRDLLPRNEQAKEEASVR